eukprot:COSAG06_NODE_4006_length_4669_cov_3.911160_1_plen_179_part_10
MQGGQYERMMKSSVVLYFVLISMIHLRFVRQSSTAANHFQTISLLHRSGQSRTPRSPPPAGDYHSRRDSLARKHVSRQRTTPRESPHKDLILKPVRMWMCSVLVHSSRCVACRCLSSHFMMPVAFAGHALKNTHGDPVFEHSNVTNAGVCIVLNTKSSPHPVHTPRLSAMVPGSSSLWL